MSFAQSSLHAAEGAFVDCSHKHDCIVIPSQPAVEAGAARNLLLG